MARRKRVALDVDFTSADIGSVMLRLHNEAVSGSYTIDDVTDWGWMSVNMTQEQFVDAYVKAWNELTGEILLTVDTGLLREAQRFYDIELVTSRKNAGRLESTVGHLMEWMELNGIGDIGLVLNNAHEHKFKLDYDFFIDDSPALARAMCGCDDRGKTLFVVDAPYNRDVPDTHNVFRVKDANAAFRRLLAIACGGSVPKHE